MSGSLSYALYADTPVVCRFSPPSEAWCLRADRRNGAFERCDRLLRPLWIGTDSDVTPLGSREEFVQELERFRGRWLTGDGPVFALYRTIRGLEELARLQGRRLTPEERALIRRLRLGAHELFEAELRQQGLTGTPPEPDAPHTRPVSGSADGGRPARLTDDGTRPAAD